MNGYRKSDRLVVPEKFSNKPDNVGAERMEGRRLPEGNERGRGLRFAQFVWSRKISNYANRRPRPLSGPFHGPFHSGPFHFHFLINL